jgi:hypothetical protein
MPQGCVAELMAEPIVDLFEGVQARARPKRSVTSPLTARLKSPP